MSFIQELFIAAFKVALPVGALSFGMSWWALTRGYVKPSGGVDALNRQIKALAKEKKKEKERKKNGKAEREAENAGEQPESAPEERVRKSNPLHDKWLKFGGGFYGLVALYTYLLVEWRELSGFIAGLGGFGAFLGQLSPGVIIEIFLDALFNFITAITWPIFWLSEIRSDRVWLWFLVAYGGYWAGIKLALRAMAERDDAGIG